MRQERTVQATIFEVFARHEIGCELKAIAQWLDGQRALVSLVAGDLRRQGVRQTGRRGLPAESVLRCALLKQQRQLSYEELAFHLEDSASSRAFARLPLPWSPKKSVLNQTIGGTAAERWRAAVDHYLPLIARIVAQSERRVLSGEAVPAGEKLVSLFEPHADIIRKSLPPRRRGAAVRFSTDTSSTWPPARAA